jgi:hypothetical protein
VLYARRSSGMSVYTKVVVIEKRPIKLKIITSNLKFGADESSGIRQAKFVAQ